MNEHNTFQVAMCSCEEGCGETINPYLKGGVMVTFMRKPKAA